MHNPPTDIQLYNLNIERSILSAVLFEPESLEEISFKLKSEDFFLPFHRHLFDAMLKLEGERKPIDETFLQSILSKSKNYDELAFLDVLSANPVSNYNSYIDEIIEYSKSRKIFSLGINLKKMIIEDDKSSDEAIATASSTLDAIDAHTTEGEQSIEETCNNFMDYLEKAKEHNGIVGISTGISSLDKLDVILNPGDLCIIGARPSVGKTALATSMIANMILDGEKILFSSLDMDSNILIMRLVATISGETIWSLKKGRPNDTKAVTHALELIKKSLIIHNKKNVSWNELRSKAKRVFRKNPDVTVWFVDHIGKIKYKEPMFRRFEIGEVTSGMKAIGEEMGVVPIALTQLNRDSVSRVGNKPNLGDLKESGAIEEDATHVILPHREAYHQKGQNEREPDVTDAELIVAKNQTGPTGVAKCKFYAKYTKFTDESHFEIEYEDDGSSLNDADNTIDMPRVLG